jgi:creatinine amidohydrolase/Fe(II)-dependent formamide hydrolase-like protein
MLGVCLAASLASAQPPAAGGGQRAAQPPEQRAAAEARRQLEMNAPRPIDALDSVWIEHLTWMEVRDAIKAGKTTGLILTGGVESNGPHLATGKHNFVLTVMGEAIARKLGNALVAPILTLEPGRPDGERVSPGSVVLSQATYRAVLTDMAESLRGMGFTTVILMGDSGGNQAAMKEVASTLNAKYNGQPSRFYFIPEYYDYSSVQKLIQESGIPEQIKIGASNGSDGIHEEYGIDALMALYDPATIRIEQRKKANRATINGVSLVPMEKTIAMGKKIVELRTRLTVDAIAKAMAANK